MGRTEYETLKILTVLYDATFDFQVIIRLGAFWRLYCEKSIQLTFLKIFQFSKPGTGTTQMSFLSLFRTYIFLLSGNHLQSFLTCRHLSETLLYDKKLPCFGSTFSVSNNAATNNRVQKKPNVQILFPLITTPGPYLISKL